MVKNLSKTTNANVNKVETVNKKKKSKANERNLTQNAENNSGKKKEKTRKKNNKTLNPLKRKNEKIKSRKFIKQKYKDINKNEGNEEENNKMEHLPILEVLKSQKKKHLKSNKNKANTMKICDQFIKDDQVDNKSLNISQEKKLNFKKEKESQKILNDKNISLKLDEKDYKNKGQELELIGFDLEFCQDNNIIMNNKKVWSKHLELDLSVHSENFILFYENFRAINSLRKNNFNVLIDIITKLSNIIKNSDETIEIYKGSIEKDFIYKKWNINLFKDYYDDVWKRKENISNYKKRNNEAIEHYFENHWKSILNFIGFDKKLKYEDDKNYFWFLWFLPNKLLIIWLAALNCLELRNNWWVKLLMEWEEYFIEILRSGGIKNWLLTFVQDEREKEDEK